MARREAPAAPEGAALDGQAGAPAPVHSLGAALFVRYMRGDRLRRREARELERFMLFRCVEELEHICSALSPGQAEQR